MKALVLVVLPVLWVVGEDGHHGNCGLPDLLSVHCRCEGTLLSCANLTSTDLFSQMRTSTVTSLHILDSNIKCLDLHDLKGLHNLRELKISKSSLRHFCKQDYKVRHKKEIISLGKLESLDLSNNKLTHIDQRLQLTDLRFLNLSSNSITRLPKKLPQHLEVLDLSFNRLSDEIDEKIFNQLSGTIEYINLEGNLWTCSPKLSWLYPWSLTLSTSARLSLGDTRCRIQNTERSSPMLVVMETYHRKVLPKCPDVCSCDIYHFGSSTISHAVYTLLVNCSGQGLEEFPQLPQFATILDLSNNKLSDASYDALDVVEFNYPDITGLVLSNNQFTILDNKLLKMKLHRFLKVDGNQLTEVPYDISLMIQKYDTEITLGGNPWACSCNSEINNINLLHKLSDLSSVSCSEASQPDSIVGYKINDIDPLILCPPSDEGARRELVLQIVCVTLAVLIVVVLSKLMYDYWQYKNKGKLPWIVYKMP